MVFGGRLRSLAQTPARRAAWSASPSSTARTTSSASTRPRPLNVSDRWELVGDRVQLPTGARNIVFRFVAARNTGTPNDAFIDSAFVSVVSENAAPDLGAYGNTAGDLGLAGAPRISLRYPDLYTDWERDKPLNIRWETRGNTAESPVRIDLYRDGPDGAAFVTTIAAATPDDGEFIWIPSSSGVDFGTRGLRIQVSLLNAPLVMDRSTEGFAVPEDGKNYWVDDRSNVGDEYTLAAIGDNRNTGKSADVAQAEPGESLPDLRAGRRLHAVRRCGQLSDDLFARPVGQHRSRPRPRRRFPHHRGRPTR